MQSKLLSIRKAEYLQAPWLGKNNSGCKPLGDRVLIQPDIAAAKVGGIQIPDDIRDRAQLSGSTGVIVEIGDDAFTWNFDRTRRWEGYRPKAGDRIYFDRYAGKEVLGKDGIVYRLMDDKCVGGIETQGSET